MTHRYILTQRDVVLLFHAVQHTTILNVRMRAHANRMNVTAQHGVHPNAGMFA